MKQVKFKIGSNNWVIKAVEKQSENLWVDERECYGVCDIENFIIYICSTGVSKDLIKSAIIHEVTHAWITCMGLRVEGDEWCEELVCELIQWHGRDIIKLSDELYKKLFEVKKREK